MVVSDLPVLARVLIWAIVIVPFGIFIWRRIQGIPLRGSRPPGDEAGRAAVEVDPAGRGPAGPSAPPGPLPPLPASGYALPAADAGLGAPSDASDRSAPSDPSSAVPAVPAPAPVDSGTARGGFFAATPATVPAGQAGEDPSLAPGRPSVAEAVRGIAMPCGLTPVIDGSTSLPNPFRVSFLTDLATAAEVGRGLGDELERLGFSLSTATPTELTARREGVELRVVLFPSAASAKRGLVAMFPAAPPGAVGVELST